MIIMWYLYLKDVKHFYREFDKIIISDKNRLLSSLKGTPNLYKV